MDDMSGEDLTSADIAAALVKMALVKEGRRGLPSREDDALFAAHARSQNRGSMDGRRRNRDRDQGPGRMSGRPRGERGGDRERVPMARLSISIGRQNKVNARHILGAIAGETGLPGKTFGRIEIQDRQTIVEAVSYTHLDVYKRQSQSQDVLFSSGSHSMYQTERGLSEGEYHGDIGHLILKSGKFHFFKSIFPVEG